MNHTLTITVEPDIDPMNPRTDMDNFGTMACWHGHHNLGDEMPSMGPDEFEGEFAPGTVILPLFLYDHSGLSMSTTPYACPWDSGQVGIIYAEPEKIRKEYGSLDSDALTKAEQVLRGEVETYDQYLQGDIWQWAVESDGEVIEGCCDCYGNDYAVNEAKEALTRLVINLAA